MAVMPDSYGDHPVVACAQRLREELAAIAAVPVELMSTAEKAAALVAVSVAADQADALRLRLLASSDDVAVEAGAHDAGAWLAHAIRGERREHQRDLRLGQALAERWRRLGEAFAGGAVNLAQARVISHALDELPDDVPGELVEQAERQLVAYAAEFGPRELRVLGRRILDVVAPEVAEAAEARALEDEERRAAETTTLTLTPCGDGTTRISGRLPDASAHRLATYLDAFASPRRVSTRPRSACLRPARARATRHQGWTCYSPGISAWPQRHSACSSGIWAATPRCPGSAPWRTSCALAGAPACCSASN